MKRHSKIRREANPARRSKMAALVFVFLLALSTFAKSVPEYQKSIEAAQLGVSELIAHLYDVEQGISEPSKAYQSAQIAKIRAALPASERVEWEGAVIETNNQWINERLDSYVTEAENSPKREQILLEISERLTAIAEKIKEFEKAQTSARTKDEDKRKLAEILSREEYGKPVEKEKSLFEQWFEAIKKWLEDLFPRPNVPQDSPNFSGLNSLSLILQILLYVVVIGIVVFLLYRFAPFLFERFRRREKREKKERVILGEKIAADESAATIFDEAEKLARQGNLRDAIRKGYIALLCELSDRKVIGLARHKTNRDYLRDVRSRREIYENMNGLTASFEKHWYGAESADEQDWSEFRQKYRQTVGSK